MQMFLFFSNEIALLLYGSLQHKCFGCCKVAVPDMNRSFDRCYPRIFFILPLKGENPGIKANASLLQNRFFSFTTFAALQRLIEKRALFIRSWYLKP